MNVRSILLVLSGCLVCCGSAMAGAREPSIDYERRCERLSAMQDGHEVKPRNGVIRLTTQPFALRFRGDEANPSLAVSLTGRLNRQLSRLAPGMLWASTGDWFAFDPDNPGALISDAEPEIAMDRDGRRRFSEIMGRRYPALLEALVDEDPRFDTAIRVGVNVSGFVEAEDGDGYLHPVSTIDGVPVGDALADELHLTYLATVDEFSADKSRAYRPLAKVVWGSCVLQFEQADDDR